MRKIYLATILCMLTLLIFAIMSINIKAIVVEYSNFATILPSRTCQKSTPSIKIDEKTAPRISDKDVELIALVTMAEAEGEPEVGKRMVIDTILNRMDSKYFPNTVVGVLYQRNQFSCMTNGRVDRCEVQEDIVSLVEEELIKRIDYEAVFFTAGDYSIYGVPMYSVSNHYFSKYE